MTTNTNSSPSAPLINGRTQAEWDEIIDRATAEARRCSQSAIDSWERSDTDGFLSQWASDASAREYRARADWARNHGYTEISVLLNEDDTIASTKNREGDYGMYWVLNDDAAARVGKRFVSDSKANTYAKKGAAYAKRGLKLGRALVPSHSPKLKGQTFSLACYSEPEWDRVNAGEITITDTDFYATLSARHDAADALPIDVRNGLDVHDAGPYRDPNTGKIASTDAVEPKPRASGSHAACSHDATKSARAACRKSRNA